MMWYLTVSATVFFYWLGLFVADKSTPKTDFASWMIILIAPLFWPIVLPVSIIELITKSSEAESLPISEISPEEVYYENEQLG